MKILIVEPDEYFHEQFRRDLPAELFFARGLAKARGFLLTEKPDLVVTELLFPDGHAYDLFAELGGLPVIVFSKIGHLEDVQATLERGVAGYFLKGQDSVRDIHKLALALVP